jgi:hypothetical protein
MQRAVTVVPYRGLLASGFNPKASECIQHRFPPFENRERWGSPHGSILFEKGEGQSDFSDWPLLMPTTTYSPTDFRVQGTLAL